MKQLKLSRLQMTQPEKLAEFNKGHILQEDCMRTIAFKLLGKYYTSSKRRANRGKPYSFKSRWNYYANDNVFTKLYLVASKQVYRLQPYDRC